MRKPDEKGMTTSGNNGQGEVRAFLESLTGQSRGTVNWLAGDALTVSVGENRDLRLRPTDDLPPHNSHITSSSMD